ncbi:MULTISPECIES: MarR family winged helix-turn-helix transcriptional regulator [Cohnella]|uniref:MarR family winged helix-turn-helix transcriptional regulator n=1 Tax=Cohnella TaxID=329857 RepID=UPI0003642E5B|nr:MULTISPECIES: MarR family transcriptional regulator [Cohnella]REK66592.1 MAG: MarR family transcriptional regulator [Cohnella sp.]
MATRQEEVIELFNMLRRYSRMWKQEWSKDNPKELSLSQVQTLDILVAEGPKSSTYLSQTLGVTSGGMTVISDKLVKMGFVRRVGDRNDRRVVLLEITEAGEAALKELQEKRVALMEKMFAPLDAEEIHQMVVIYRKLLRTWETRDK